MHDLIDRIREVLDRATPALFFGALIGAIALEWSAVTSTLGILSYPVGAAVAAMWGLSIYNLCVYASRGVRDG